MIEKGFEAIVKADIDALVTNAVSEGRTIEYKEQLPAGLDDGSREFLADVSSFANAGGGDLVFGIREQRDADGKPTGIPEAADGLAGVNADAQKLRLENLLRDGIDPRIPGVRITHLDGFSAGPVIVIRVPKSWASPHMVKFKNLSRFFSRTSAGKYQLDVREIRASVLASESLGDKISAFRSDRVGKTLAGEAPVLLEVVPRIVLHLLPIRAFSEPVAFDLKQARVAWDKNVRPIGSRVIGATSQFNFDGLLSCCTSGASKGDNYVQLFRNGAIEAVCAVNVEKLAVVGWDFDQKAISDTPAYAEFQNGLGLGPPLFVAISFLSVKGLSIFQDFNASSFRSHWVKPIQQDVLLAPEVLVEENRADMGGLLRPALDTIWQASGWPGSPGYDTSGKWIGHNTSHA